MILLCVDTFVRVCLVHDRVQLCHWVMKTRYSGSWCESLDGQDKGSGRDQRCLALGSSGMGQVF